jgi:hypothetical protein
MGYGHRFGRGGSQSPCPKGRREYMLVDLSPASITDTPLQQGDWLPTDYGRGLDLSMVTLANADYGRHTLRPMGSGWHVGLHVGT